MGWEEFNCKISKSSEIGVEFGILEFVELNSGIHHVDEVDVNPKFAWEQSEKRLMVQKGHICDKSIDFDVVLLKSCASVVG